MPKHNKHDHGDARPGLAHEQVDGREHDPGEHCEDEQEHAAHDADEEIRVELGAFGLLGQLGHELVYGHEQECQAVQEPEAREGYEHPADDRDCQ
jgi:hypothetical protein